MSHPISFIALVLSLGSSSLVSANDCAALLIPDESRTQMDLTTTLSYLSVITSENFEQHKRT